MAGRPLEGKVAIVTGAAMGMGKTTARVFAAAGAYVPVSDINPELGQATVERIEKDGGSASFCLTDVSRAADAEAMVRAAVERYGRLDCAVNRRGGHTGYASDRRARRGGMGPDSRG
jgi:NAD(P)-dependent dehydrogenase (short-subunit alcohol dehydrogenase family)